MWRAIGGFEGAAVAADSFDKCLLDLGIGPAADAF
jgi:hypothetical protein